MSLANERLDGNNPPCYTELMSEVDVMKAIEVIQNALRVRGMKQKDLAMAIGMSPQGFSKKLVNNTLSSKELFEALELMGLEAFYRDKVTGAEVKELRRGVLPHVSMVVDGIRYDTDKSDALCHTEELGGFRLELYKDHRGSYFVALHPDWDEANPFISPCDIGFAKELYGRHRGIDDPDPDVLFANESG